MKKSLPFVAVLAATLTTPVLAQDMSAFLNPHAMAHDLGLRHGSVAVAPTIVRPNTQALVLSAPAVVAAPSFDQGLGRAIAISPDVADLGELLGAAQDAAPTGANTLILSRPAPRPTWFQRVFGL